MRARQRLRRGYRYREPALWPAGQRDRAAGASHSAHAEGHRPCRAPRLRPRYRLHDSFRRRRTNGAAVMKRIGIDVGGTNTDAVLIDGNRLLAAIKAASPSLPPFIDWPEDLATLVRGQVHMVAGGHEYDGRSIVALDVGAIRDAARRMADAGLTAVGVTSVFSPLTSECEREAERILAEEIPKANITVSHELGRIGLLERENVTLLNACLQDLAHETVAAFTEALRGSGLTAPLFLTQNDGTIMRAETASRFPVWCFASGPTNSMRGAAFLSGLDDGVVVDVGGTTSDIGYLKGGFPREANAAVEIGGVRTLFRMPDLLSIGLGGGTEVSADGVHIGPRSVGFRLLEKGLVFGGDTLTATDIACAAGRVDLGQRKLVAGLPQALVTRCLTRMSDMIAEGVDRMKTEA